MTAPIAAPDRSLEALAQLTDEALHTLTAYLSPTDVDAGSVLMREGDDDRVLYFVCDGSAALQRGEHSIGRWERGSHFGEFGLVVGSPRAATASATTPMRLLRLTHAAWVRLQRDHPQVAAQVLEGLLRCAGDRLSLVTDAVGANVQGRTSPRHATVSVATTSGRKQMPTGVTPYDLLPPDVDGLPVVAALVEGNVVPLDTPLSTDVRVQALTTAHWEGQRIYRRSAALLLLEAAASLEPDRRFSLGSSLSNHQWIEVTPSEGLDLAELSARLETRMRAMVEHDLHIRHEWWPVEEAIAWFNDRGWESSALLLHLSREPAVQLVSCGALYFLSLGALASRAGRISRFSVKAVSDRLLLVAGGDEKSTAMAASHAYGDVLRQHARWLASLGVRSVGAFNTSCVRGQVSDIIRVAEGFHEKRFTHIADTIASRSGVRVVCIAGPSSSGKTTFIKRLRVQLQVNGLDPLTVSLDDYYKDRERCPRGADGDYDFEALEALDLELLASQLERLLRGETVRLARFDFVQGRSLPEGGKEVCLGETGLLMLEGIHGLNPALLGPRVSPDVVFRIFIQPMSSLSFDPLSRVNPSDLRLIRRIVRDRHGRKTTAAESIARWPSVKRGEHEHIFPFIPQADVVFDTSLIYELSVLKVYAERYLLEVPRSDPAFATAVRLRQLIDRFVAIYPDHVPPTSILREFIGASSFEY